jgi:hypothetical protein
MICCANGTKWVRVFARRLALCSVCCFNRFGVCSAQTSVCSVGSRSAWYVCLPAFKAVSFLLRRVSPI